MTLPFSLLAAAARNVGFLGGIAAALISVCALTPVAAEVSGDELIVSESVVEPDPESAEGDFEERAQTIQQWLKKRELERIEMGLSHQYEHARSVHDPEDDDDPDSDSDSGYGGYRKAGHGLFVKLRHPSYRFRHDRYSRGAERRHSGKAVRDTGLIHSAKIRHKSDSRGRRSGIHVASRDVKTKRAFVAHNRSSSKAGSVRSRQPAESARGKNKPKTPKKGGSR